MSTRITKYKKGALVETFYFSEKVNGKEIVTNRKYYTLAEVNARLEQLNTEVMNLNEIKTVLESE